MKSHLFTVVVEEDVLEEDGRHRDGRRVVVSDHHLGDTCPVPLLRACLPPFPV